MDNNPKKMFWLRSTIFSRYTRINSINPLHVITFNMTVETVEVP
jgi:hypothetical protein